MSLEGQKRASLFIRVFAKILDFIIVAVMAEVIPRAGFYAGLFYMLIADSLFNGRSPGKYLMGIKTISVKEGLPCSVRESVIRNSPFAIGLLLYKIPLIGWIFLIFITAFEFLILLGSKEGMRLGDELAKTLVIEFGQGKDNQFKPHEEA